MRVVVVGVGGVGTRIAREMPMYLARKYPGSEVVLIDGDAFEHKNRDRQDFDADLGMYENKAATWAAELSRKWPELVITHYPDFVTEHNIEGMIREGDAVFCCVDNHPSRKLLSDHVSKLQNGVLVSGGNEYTDGNTQIYLRREGQDRTPPITYLHPEIEFPVGKNPAEMSCEERAASGAPQLQFTNLKVATEMMCAFYAATTEEPRYSEVYFDIIKGTQRALMRKKYDEPAAGETETGLADRPGNIEAAVG